MRKGYFLLKTFNSQVPEERGAHAIGTGGKRARPPEGIGCRRAIEMHMLLSCIAMGILQSLSIRFIGKVGSSQIRYQRTPSKGRVSEAALIHYFRKYFFRLLEQKPKSCITQIIHELQAESEEQWDLLAS